jgi:cytochrome c-type biogenesis protein CcmH/NrfF
VNGQTIMLWASPFLALFAGLWLFWRRQRPEFAGNATQLSADEEARIEALIRDQK